MAVAAEGSPRLGLALALVTIGVLLSSVACVRESLSGPVTRRVRVDGKTNRFDASFESFFPNTLSVRPGDTVTFELARDGEPHTVTMGSLVNESLKSAARTPPVPVARVDGSGTIAQNATRPCFLKRGQPATDPAKACPTRRQPTFDGSDSYYSSGLLKAGEPFRVRLADTTAPGEYRFVCNFHPDMAGTIVVAPKRSRIPSQDEVDGAAGRRLDSMVDEALPAFLDAYKPFRRTRAGSFPFPALAGLEIRTSLGMVRVIEFLPFTIKARVGERVTWSLSGAQTISFNPPKSAKGPIVERLGGGSVVVNRDALVAWGTSLRTEGWIVERTTIDTGSYDGKQTRSSGVLASAEPNNVVFGLSFSRPGTFRYESLVHPGMSGLVMVSR